MLDGEGGEELEDGDDEELVGAGRLDVLVTVAGEPAGDRPAEDCGPPDAPAEHPAAASSATAPIVTAQRTLP